MGYLRRLLKQTATYWAAGTYNDYGDQTLATPATWNVRWEDRTELFIDLNGDEKHSKAVVYSTAAMSVGGYLFLGTSTVANPETVDGADQIRRVDMIRDVKGTNPFYKVIL